MTFKYRLCILLFFKGWEGCSILQYVNNQFGNTPHRTTSNTHTPATKPRASTFFKLSSWNKDLYIHRIYHSHSYSYSFINRVISFYSILPQSYSPTIGHHHIPCFARASHIMLCAFFSIAYNRTCIKFQVLQHISKIFRAWTGRENCIKLPMKVLYFVSSFPHSGQWSWKSLQLKLLRELNRWPITSTIPNLTHYTDLSVLEQASL